MKFLFCRDTGICLYVCAGYSVKSVCLQQPPPALLFFFSLKFIYFERERACARGGGVERGRQRIPSRLYVVSTEPDAGLKPTDRKIVAWGEIRSPTLNWLSHWGAPHHRGILSSAKYSDSQDCPGPYLVPVYLEQCETETRAYQQDSVKTFCFSPCSSLCSRLVIAEMRGHEILKKTVVEPAWHNSLMLHKSQCVL